MRKAELSLEQLLALLTGLGEPVMPTGYDDPTLFTAEEMIRGQKLMTDCMAAESLDDLEKLGKLVEYWHDEPGLSDNKYRHLYNHACLDFVAAIAVVKFGPVALEKYVASRI